MASLLDNWLQPLIDEHLPHLWRFAQNIPTEEFPSSQISGSLDYSSPGSQANYKIQQLILPKQNILQLRIRFTDDAAECLQLLTYFNRDHGVRCNLSDGTSAISARISLSAVQKLIKEEGLSLTNLSVGTILQVPIINIRFTIKSSQETIQSIKTELDIHHFRVVDRSSSVYGHPKLIGKSAAYEYIIGGKIQLPIFKSSRPRAALPSLPTSVSPGCGASEDRAAPESDTTFETVYKWQRHPSQDLDIDQKSSENADAKLVQGSIPDQDEPLPSIEMATTCTSFSAELLKDWKDLSDLPRCITLVSEDQEDLLNGNAHLDERGDRHPTWLPPNGRDYASAPLPARLKQEIIAQILADQKARSDSENSSTPRRTSLKPISRDLNGLAMDVSTRQSTRKQPALDSDKENESDAESISIADEEPQAETNNDDDDDEQPISDWEISPPRPPLSKFRNELPPDTPEHASSMPLPSSPVQNEHSNEVEKVTTTASSQNKNQKDSPNPEPTTRSRLHSEAVLPQKASHNIPVPRFGTATPRATPRPEQVQQPVQKLGKLGSVMHKPSSSYVPSTYASVASRSSTPSILTNIYGKRQASEVLAPAVSKRRNLNIAFGMSQNTPVASDPRREISGAKREFLMAQSARRVSSTAEPTSSRVPETQFTPMRSAVTRGPGPVPAKHNHNNSVSSAIKGNNLPIPVDQQVSTFVDSRTTPPDITASNRTDSADAFQIFKSAYSQYTGDRNHFTKLCKQLFAVRTTFAKILWDDFVVRHKTEYVPYATECINDGEPAKSYVEFCSEYDVLYSKRILTPDLLKAAANPPS